MSNDKSQKGLSLIELIISLGLFALVFLGIWGALQLSFGVSLQSQARITAVALAQERMEMIRNLPYDKVGTQGGIPPGDIPASEQVERNGINYLLETSVIYVDDPFDGLAPEDVFSADYKKARVEISWQGRISSNVPLVLVTTVAPPSLESELSGGVLSLKVFNAQGQPESGAKVTIKNDQIEPEVNLTVETDTQGEARLAGVPPSNESYKIWATRPGFSEDRTWGPEQVPQPLKPHLTVLEGQVTEASFAIDILGELSVFTYKYLPPEQAKAPVKNLEFSLTGAKLIGYDDQDQPVPKYQISHQTDSNGQVVIPNLEWDTYLPQVDGATTGYDIAESHPPFPFELLPGETKTLELYLAPHQQNTLLVTVKEANGQSLSGALVRLFNGLDYDETQETSSWGQTFFSPLSAGSYSLEISLAGYETFQENLSISGQTFKEVTLNPL